MASTNNAKAKNIRIKAMKLDYNTRTQWHYYTIHTEKENVNRYRSIKYNEIDFDVLMIEITANGRSRYFAIPATALPKTTNSIHFTYYSPSDIRWSPANISDCIEELDVDTATKFSLGHNFQMLPNDPVYFPAENEFEEVEDDIYKARKKTIRNWIIAIIIIIISLSIFVPSNNDSDIGLSQTSAQGGVRVFLKYNYLTDPDSYCPEDFSNVVQLNASQNTYSIIHTYRARNGFGGYVRETQIFELDSKGNVISHYPL